MKLFEITLPQRTNAGQFYTHALAAWENYAAMLAGGFTRLAPCDGVWLDGNKRYHDTVIKYQVACAPGLFLALREKAFDLFPDQVAIMTAELGTADITYRTARAVSTAREVA